MTNAYSVRNLLSARSLLRLAIIGVVLAAVLATFGFTGGWFSPTRLTQARVVDQFEQTNGPHPGFRRNHSKGVCFSGWFDSDGAGERLSKAAVFQPGRTPVFGRFALAGGQPFVADAPTAVRSMAVNFMLRDGEVWRTGMNSIPVFPVGNVQDFFDQLKALEPDPRTGRPDAGLMKAFLSTHPGAAHATEIIKSAPHASGFANSTYNSLNAFIFRNAQGHATPVRWSMRPEDAFSPAIPSDTGDKNYQFDEMAERLRRGPVHWRLVAIVAAPGDSTSDATELWPDDRQQVSLGLLSVDRLVDEEHGPCRDVTFDPLILPSGIEGSDDPILSARSATYSVSFTRRASEAPGIGAVRLASPGTNRTP